MKKYINNNKKEIIIISITLILFLILSLLIKLGKTSYVDSQVHSFVINIRTDSLTNFFTYFTNLAGATFLLALSVILLIIMKNKKKSLYIFVNLACSFFINELAKNIFVRSRPIGINLIEETGLSFPSGHSMVCLSFYGFIAYLLCKNFKKKKHKILILISLTVITLLIGFSRIYLGVHYLTDVIGGFLLSIICLTIFIKITQKSKEKK